MSRDRIPHYTKVTQCQLSHLARSMSDAVFILRATPRQSFGVWSNLLLVVYSEGMCVHSWHLAEFPHSTANVSKVKFIAQRSNGLKMKILSNTASLTSVWFTSCLFMTFITSCLICIKYIFNLDDKMSLKVCLIKKILFSPSRSRSFPLTNLCKQMLWQ